MRLAIGVSTILVVFSAVLLAQVSPKKLNRECKIVSRKKKRRLDRRTVRQPNQAISPMARLPNCIKRSPNRKTKSLNSRPRCSS